MPTAKPRDWHGECLQNDLFCVEWDVETQLSQSQLNQSIVSLCLPVKFVKTEQVVSCKLQVVC